jgi:hypothetical protein
LKHIINTFKYIKNILSTHLNTLMSFKTHCNIIYVPLKCILIFLIYIEILPNTLQYLQKTYIPLTYVTTSLLYSDSLPSTFTYDKIVLKLHFFVLLLNYFTKLSWLFIILQNCHGSSLFYKNVLALAMTYLLESNEQKHIPWIPQISMVG